MKISFLFVDSILSAVVFDFLYSISQLDRLYIIIGQGRL